MRNTLLKSTVVTGCLLGGLVLSSKGSIVQTSLNSANWNAYDGDVTPNLITAGQSSLSSVTAPTGEYNGTFPVSGLNDGSAAGNGNYTYYAVNQQGGGGQNMPDTITFLLTGGYDISKIQVISGWSGVNLGEQNFEVDLQINNGSFVSYGTFQNINGAFANSASGYETTLTSSSGPIASDVTGIQFVFMDPGYNITQEGDGGTVIHELQAFGVTTVPEPATFTLFGLAAAGLMVMRRRSAR